MLSSLAAVDGDVGEDVASGGHIAADGREGQAIPERVGRHAPELALATCGPLDDGRGVH